MSGSATRLAELSRLISNLDSPLVIELTEALASGEVAGLRVSPALQRTCIALVTCVETPDYWEAVFVQYVAQTFDQMKRDFPYDDPAALGRHFSRSLDAFLDGLRSLDGETWSGFCCILRNSASILERDRARFHSLVAVFTHAGEEWRARGTPFKLVLS